MAVIGKGFAKYLRRAPLSDEEITQALVWIRDEVESILSGDTHHDTDPAQRQLPLPLPEVKQPVHFDLPAFTVADDTAPADDYGSDDDAEDIGATGSLFDFNLDEATA